MDKSTPRLSGPLRDVAALGRVDLQGKMKEMAEAEVLAVPSLRGESFGIVLVEGMAAGVPVVASDIPAYRAVLDDGKLGRLVPPGDPVALANNLLAVLRDADLRRDLAARAYTGVEMFAWPRVATDIMAAYRDAMEESSAPGRLAWEAGTPPFSPVSATEGQ